MAKRPETGEDGGGKKLKGEPSDGNKVDIVKSLNDMATTAAAANTHMADFMMAQQKALQSFMEAQAEKAQAEESRRQRSYEALLNHLSAKEQSQNSLMEQAMGDAKHATEMIVETNRDLMTCLPNIIGDQMAAHPPQVTLPAPIPPPADGDMLMDMDTIELLDPDNAAWNKILETAVGKRFDKQTKARVQKEIDKYEEKFGELMEANLSKELIAKDLETMASGNYPKKARRFRMPFVHAQWDEKPPAEFFQTPSTVTFVAGTTYREVKEQLYKGFLLANKKLDELVNEQIIGVTKTAVDFNTFVANCKRVAYNDDFEKLDLDWLPKLCVKDDRKFISLAIKICRKSARSAASKFKQREKEKKDRQKADQDLLDKAASLSPDQRWKAAVKEAVNEKTAEEEAKAEELRRKGKGKGGKSGLVEKTVVDYKMLHSNFPTGAVTAAQVPTKTIMVQGKRSKTKKELAERKNRSSPAAAVRGNDKTTAQEGKGKNKEYEKRNKGKGGDAPLAPGSRAPKGSGKTGKKGKGKGKDGAQKGKQKSTKGPKGGGKNKGKTGKGPGQIA